MELNTNSTYFKISYGLFFVIIVPLILIAWSIRLSTITDLDLIEIPYSTIGYMGSFVILLFGMFLILKGMFDLTFVGKGLPMNASPPKKFVSTGIYKYLSHPIYLGALIISFGISLYFNSSVGLFITTPILGLMCISLVIGYEIPYMKKAYKHEYVDYDPIIKNRLFLIIIILIYAFLYFRLDNDSINTLKILIYAISLIAILITGKYLWRYLVNISERIANSRKDWLFFNGHFRIINHSIYSGMAAGIGVGIISYITQEPIATLLLIIFILLGAAFFAQVMWGNENLLRPFGYWGGVWGAIIGIIFIKIVFDIDILILALAAVLAAPFSQAIGRFRCLVQGCCHGIQTRNNYGIKVYNSQSRVCLLSKLKGKNIHPTQLYSIVFNIVLGLILFNLWHFRIIEPLLIISLYLILTSLERFAEDAYRGETQTPIYWGLKESQWNAIVILIVGFVIVFLPWNHYQKSDLYINSTIIFTSLVGGLFGAFMLSMDFPKSQKRYSRLSG